MATSPNDTVVLYGSGGAIVDASGNRWTITHHGQVAVNGTTDGTTANVKELAYVNGAIWQENSQNLWWSKTSPSATWGPYNGTSVSPLSIAPPPPPPPTPTGVFSVVNGQIIDPSGAVWHGYGCAVYRADAQTFGSGLATTLHNEFSNMNLVRLAGQLNDTPASYAPFVNAMTAAGGTVVIEHHDGSNSVLSGTSLTTESNWYAGMAKYYAGNPRVLFETMNEPGINDSAQMQATYNALRGAGYNGTIFLEAGQGAGGIAGTFGSTSWLSSAVNVAWDLHCYNWQSNYSTSVSTIQADQNNRISTYQAIHSADGVMPVICLETGEATNGLQRDVGGVAELAATFGNSHLSGAAAWAWDNWGTSGLVNSLTNPGGNSLTAYGSQVASLIAAHP